MSRMTKLKELKKPEVQKTNRRRPTDKVRRTMSSSALQDGMTVDALEKQMCNTKSRHMLYDVIKNEYAFTVPEFLKYVPENIRLPVPIRERRRVRIGQDEEYFPGQNIKMENTEYYFVQAPVKKTARLVWKIVQQERIRLMVCLCHDDQMTTGNDASKCYVYFPTEPGRLLVVEQQKKGTYTIVCKSREDLSMGAIRYELEMTDSEVVIDKNSDDPNAPNDKTHKVVLYHMNTWTGLKPESGTALEQAENVATFSREVKKYEMDILRKSMENYVPPVLIQSFDGINRSAILWVALMLLRDCEKRECFDVPGLMKSIMKLRIGSLSTYFQFCFCMAVCLLIGKDMKWCENDCNTALIELTGKVDCLKSVNDMNET